jgi:hypothetical protein
LFDSAVGCGYQSVDALLVVTADFDCEIFWFSSFFLQFLLYHMDAVVLCSRLLIFLYSCIIFYCLAFVNLMFIGPCVILIVE